MSYQVKSATNSIKRFPFQALAAIFILAITFFVGSVLAILVYSSAKTLSYFETRPQVIAFLKNEATNETIADLQHRLSADSRIKEVRYVSKEEALLIYKNATSDNPLLGELVNPSIFPASLEFSLIDLSEAENVISSVKSESIVDTVGFTASLGGEKNLGDTVVRLRNITFYLRAGGAIFAVLLIGTSFLVLVITLGMRIATKKDEIEILKLIGAKTSFIRNPILIESMIYVLTGVFLGWVMTLIIVLYLAPSAIAYFGEIPILPRSPLSLFILFGIILGTEIIGGIILAFAGSMLAFSRARKSR